MQRLRWIGFIAAGVLAACAPAATSTNEVGGVTPAPTSVGPTTEQASAPTDAPAATDEVMTAPTTEDVTEAAVVEPTEAIVLAPGQRSAPLAVDAGLHNDDVRVFAATGRPQFIEVFAFW